MSRQKYQADAEVLKELCLAAGLLASAAVNCAVSLGKTPTLHSRGCAGCWTPGLSLGLGSRGWLYMAGQVCL